MSDLSEQELKRQHEESFIRKLVDSPFWLLLLSLLVVFISYTTWGMIELFNVPTSPLK